MLNAVGKVVLYILGEKVTFPFGGYLENSEKLTSP